MKPLWRNVLAVIAGIVAACVVNMGTIVIGGLFIAPPEGADMTTLDGIKAAMTQMTPMHFLFPFLAHALGTLVGGTVAALTAASHKLTFALAIGVIFLGFGIVMVIMVGGPAWFIVLDLGAAYLPMAWIGGQIGKKVTDRGNAASA